MKTSTIPTSYPENMVSTTNLQTEGILYKCNTKTAYPTWQNIRHTIWMQEPKYDGTHFSKRDNNGLSHVACKVECSEVYMWMKICQQHSFKLCSSTNLAQNLYNPLSDY